MLNLLKEKMISKGMSLMQSPAVSKILESEQMGIVIEKAMSVPIKVSGAIMTQKERLVSLFDLVTQQDLDELRQNLSRVEGKIKEIKDESDALAQKMKDKGTKKKTASK